VFVASVLHEDLNTDLYDWMLAHYTKSHNVDSKIKLFVYKA